MRNRLLFVKLFVVLFCVWVFCLGVVQARPPAREAQEFNSYRQVIEKTVGMLSDSEAMRFAQKYGLNILNVTWEDTGRYKGSSVGPNISDMTIQVQIMDPRTEQYTLHCMPVIRFPNFSDQTCDVKLDDFYVLVGNERGKKLNKITLRKYLGNLRWYLTKPNSWKGGLNTLLAPRDTHVLVSAQACFLPIPKNGSATFNPVLFNYQSYDKNPAVLAILATREGTSATIIDNKRDAFPSGGVWGQRLFYNKNGERASFTGQRLSEFLQEKTPDGKTKGETLSKDAQEGLNMVLLIQVPLKQVPQPRRKEFAAPAGCLPCAPCESAKSSRSDVESAVIGHGKVEGPFTEIDGLTLFRQSNQHESPRMA